MQNEQLEYQNERANQEQELYDRAAFGKQIEQFWGSPIGNYLQSRARECYTAGVLGLKSCDPTDWRVVQGFQNQIAKSEDFEKWLSDGVADGLKALEILEGNDE